MEVLAPNTEEAFDFYKSRNSIHGI